MEHAAAVSPPAGGLSPRDREVLAFERQWWKYAGAKEQAIRDRFGLSATRYYQLLNVRCAPTPPARSWRSTTTARSLVRTRSCAR